MATGKQSEAIAGLAGTEHPQHPHITGALIVAGVGEYLIKGTVTAGAGQFAYPGMLADRIAARVLAQSVDRCPNLRQPAPRPRP